MSRLSKIAAALLHEALKPENAEDWHKDWEAWHTKHFGPRPSMVREAARREWDVAACATLMAFKWFDEVLTDLGVKEKAPDTGKAPTVDLPPEDLPPDRVPAPPALVVPRSTFAVLGPSGEPLIEGVKP